MPATDRQGKRNLMPSKYSSPEDGATLPWCVTSSPDKDERTEQKFEEVVQRVVCLILVTCWNTLIGWYFRCIDQYLVLVVSVLSVGEHSFIKINRKLEKSCRSSKTRHLCCFNLNRTAEQISPTCFTKSFWVKTKIAVRKLSSSRFRCLVI